MQIQELFLLIKSIVLNKHFILKMRPSLSLSLSDEWFSAGKIHPANKLSRRIGNFLAVRDFPVALHLKIKMLKHSRT